MDNPWDKSPHVVVFPLVPVTQIILTPLESRDNISGHRRSATLPGKVVAPLPKKCNTPAKILATNNENIIVNYIEIFFVYAKIIVAMQQRR